MRLRRLAQKSLHRLEANKKSTFVLAAQDHLSVVSSCFFLESILPRMDTAPAIALPILFHPSNFSMAVICEQTYCLFRDMGVVLRQTRDRPELIRQLNWGRSQNPVQLSVPKRSKICSEAEFSRKAETSLFNERRARGEHRFFPFPRGTRRFGQSNLGDFASRLRQCNVRRI